MNVGAAGQSRYPVGQIQKLYLVQHNNNNNNNNNKTILGITFISDYRTSLTFNQTFCN